MERIRGEIVTGIDGKEQEEEIARKIKAGVDEEDFFKLGIERQKMLLKRIKFEEGEAIRKLLRNMVEKNGDEGLQLMKYIDFDAGIENEESLVEIIGELESIPIIRECKKMISRLIEANTDKNEAEVGVDWERQYREEAKQRQAVEAELKTIKSKYEGVLSILQKKVPHKKEHSKKEISRFFEIFEKKNLKNLTKALSKDPSLIFADNGYWKSNTLLHTGVDIEWIEGMEAVIEYGVGIEGFVDMLDNDGNTSLIVASNEGKLNVVKFLVSKGANIEAKDHFGYTVLMGAVYKGKFEVAEFLISKGANIEARDNGGKTPLMYACSEGHLEAVQFLLSKGANIEAKDNHGNTALIWACHWNHLDIVKFLYSKGANIDAKDNEGKTALMDARSRDCFEIVEFLTSKGAKE